MEHVYYPSNDGKTTIHAVIWRPEGEVKAVLQIIHGMAEYAERYAPFAENLVKQGILVCAEDHLGHGKSVISPDRLGFFTDGNGEFCVLEDIRKLTLKIKESCSAPYFLLGHSMGSFFCRKYISIYGEELAGAIIMGTGFQPALLTGAGKAVTKIIAAFKGWQYRSKFVDNLAFGAYNNNFEKRTDLDWLSVDCGNVDAYIADELCGVKFTCSGFYTLFSVVADACKAQTIKAVPKTLPLYLVAGDCDPVGSFSKGVVKLYDKLCASGVRDVHLTLYKGFRHEVLNDGCAPQVTQDILDFIEARI